MQIGVMGKLFQFVVKIESFLKKEKKKDRIVLKKKKKKIESFLSFNYVHSKAANIQCSKKMKKLNFFGQIFSFGFKSFLFFFNSSFYRQPKLEL